MKGQRGVRWMIAAAGIAVQVATASCQDRVEGREGEMKPSGRFAIAIHGGAGPSAQRATEQANRERVASLERALQIGVDVLSKGGASLDAVEAVVAFLEDDPRFNAGKGAVFTSDDGHELDASIMDGRTKACGGVAGVRRVKNPIRLARLVMTETPHVLLSGPGAEAFAESQGVDLVPNDSFDTPETREKWEQRKRRQLERPQSAIQFEDVGSYVGTVGCVALDQTGDLAAATSTGGMTGKLFGRIGDSPIVGAGTYADNATCAVSCTGIGEEFIRHAVAYDVAAQMRYLQRPLDESVRHVLEEVLRPNDGGLIAVDREGRIVMRYNTPGMARAAADSEGRFEVLWLDPLNDRPDRDEGPR